MIAKDLLGQPINVGDLICYGTTAGRSAQIGVYEVTEVTEVMEEKHQWRVPGTTFAIKATPIGTASYRQNTKKSVKLSMLERALVLPPHYRNLIEKENGND